MEFKSLKNIESSFRQIRLFGIVFLSLCAVITVWSVWSSYRFAERQREKIYVLDNGKSLMLALSQDLSQNRPAEAREHVRRFHELFFTLSPEKSAIEHNVKRALLLADKSVYNYYSDFAEKGYYNRIIAGNINQVLKVDSVVCDFNGYPYRAVTYATQKIIRQLVPFGRQSQRFHHRGLHHHREQGFTNHQKVTDMKKIRKSFWRAYWKLHDKKKMLVARLKGYLDGLPPKTRKRIVLAMLAAFTVLALYTFGKAVYDIGRNDGSRIVTDHAGQVELSVKPENNHNVIPYLYGTDEE